MSALAAGVNKKRKKSDTKPQAQINKCNNEKRRREQENIYIEELAELISARFADMSSLSVKPDKCAILQETVNQIRSIKQQESAAQSTDPVQQGEVSSSRPTILSNEVYGPLLLEALEGFLFVVNAEGKVEHVTENVSTYITFTREEVLGKSIYNFIHHGDHSRFSKCLLPIGWANEPTQRSKSFSCRLLVKPPDDQDESMEEKQQRTVRYELMQISSTQLRDQVVNSEDDGGDSSPCLLCVASRITHREKSIGANIEQFTTKLDTTGKIIGVDTSGVSSTYSQFLNKDLMGRVLQDLCPQSEVHKLTSHLRDTLSSAGQATSVIYRLRIGQDKFVHVQTKSKFFKANPHTNAESDFIMATHSIIGENDSTGPSDPGGGNNNSVGGPLMTSVINGTRNGAPVSSGSDSSSATSSNALINTNMPFSNFGFDNDIFEFPSSTWAELEPSNWGETRPDSRQSVTPVSTPTPRPPSAPAYSPATTVAQSPSLAPFVSQPSPTLPSTPVNPYSNSFTFSPLAEPNFPVDEPQQQQQQQQQQTQQQQQQQQQPQQQQPQQQQQKETKVNAIEESSPMMADSAKLRNLLTKPTNSVDSVNDAESKNRNRILKGLLNQQDEDENRGDNRSSPRGRNAVPGPAEVANKTSASGGGGNNMLRQLLNDNSDDDDLEARAGIKNRSELLQQLLKDDEERKSDQQSQSDDPLLRSLGFSSSPSPPGEPGRARKRPSDDRDDNPSKRADGQVSSSATVTGSKLCERNKMLASLLAKQPSNQPIPPLPPSVISATPQEKLPRITPDPNLNKNMSNRIMNQQNMQQQNIMNSTRRMPGRPPNTNYLNQMLTPAADNMQRTQPNRQVNQVPTAGSYPPNPVTTNADKMWDMPSSDPLLSDILDQVIEFVPEVSMTNNSANDIINLLESIDTPQSNNSYQQPINEKMAINIIQESLMQCENEVKSPSSPTISLPGTPPAYSTSMTTQNSQSGIFPPPNYPRAGFTNIQRAQVRAGAPQYAMAGTISNPQQLLLQQQQRKQLLQQQEQHKRRLLQQQQQQQLLIPSNAAAEMNPGLQNIDSLLNNTVAPNVSLQRSSSVPESQLSPNYSGQLNQQNQRLNNQQPYSPHSQLTSPIGQQSGFAQTTASNYQQGGARLSPHPPFNQQLSPRQSYPQGNNQNANWQQAQSRLTVQQQQNPMLNAQLTGSYVSGPNSRGFAVQRATQQQQRAMGSPGAAATRHSPFPNDSFPPPASPNSAFNQNQYLRLQRTNSAPNATTQLPGGLGSPRPYGREHHPHPYSSLPPSHHPMMYQQDSQYCYDQTGLQLTYNGADRGRAPQHLQPGVSGSGTTSEYVRQELRAIVGARTGQAQPTTARPPSQLMNQQQVNSTDLDALGLGFDMPTSGASESPKLWGAMGSDMGSMSPQPATSRSSMEEGRQGDHKSSLLQKLLSE